MTENNIRTMIYGMIVGEIMGGINSRSNTYDAHIYPYKLVHPFQHDNLSLHLRCMFQLGNSVLQTKMYDKDCVLSQYFLTINRKDCDTIKCSNMVNILKIYREANFLTNHADVLTKLGARGLLKQNSEALLRCVTLIPCGDEIVREDCFITNPFGDCVDCNIFFLKILKNCLLKQPIKLDEQMSTNLNIRKIIFLAKNKLPLDLKYDLNSWSNTLYCGLYVFSHINSFEEGMSWVIKNSSREDMKENAAIVGCILGAKIGGKLYRESVTEKNFTEMTEILGRTGLGNYIDFYINVFEQSFMETVHKK